MLHEQFVCKVCGYNMVGYYPERCPFCGSPREAFITSEECSSRYKVESTPVNERVSRLNSVPRLGLEHAAYHLETPNRTYWIDCPSSFDKRLNSADVQMFTHHHFLGASNQYREHWGMEVRIHELDSKHELCRGFTFDAPFKEDFLADGIEAFHIGGHTAGFTLYFFQECLFICDYVLFRKDRMFFNPFGPWDETLVGGRRIREILADRPAPPSWVCGVNYVMQYGPWWEQFRRPPMYEVF